MDANHSISLQLDEIIFSNSITLKAKIVIPLSASRRQYIDINLEFLEQTLTLCLDPGWSLPKL